MTLPIGYTGVMNFRALALLLPPLLAAAPVAPDLAPGTKSQGVVYKPLYLRLTKL